MPGKSGMTVEEALAILADDGWLAETISRRREAEIADAYEAGRRDALVDAQEALGGAFRARKGGDGGVKRGIGEK